MPRRIRACALARVRGRMVRPRSRLQQLVESLQVERPSKQSADAAPTVSEVSADLDLLDELWLFVRDHLPVAPSRVLELGCGAHGGFVPRMRAAGHEAIGVDPRAPEGAEYRRVRFEELIDAGHFDAVVACTALHHVADLNEIALGIVGCMDAGGVLVIIEWAWERVDEATARWCFAHLAPTSQPSWLTHRRDEWLASGLPWETYLREWASDHRIHRSDDIRTTIDGHFDLVRESHGPYYFADLDGVTAADERAAIDAGTIRAPASLYVGRRR
jgi:SAM-dependent methyltransferase